MLVATVWAQAELAALFILAGLLVMVQRAWPGLRGGLLLSAAGALGMLGIWGLETFLLGAETTLGHESSLGCDISHLAPPGTVVEHWDDVPAPSQQLVQVRDAIYAHVERLVEELTQGTS